MIKNGDENGNTRTLTRNYIAGYTETVQNYLHPSAYMNSGYTDDFDDPIAYSIIESDLFTIVIQVHAYSILSNEGGQLACCFDVSTMYYCKESHRLDYNLETDERPLYAPHGTVIELNFEMSESNTNLADNSVGIVKAEQDDDRSFWPHFACPNRVSATDQAITGLSKVIGTLTGYLGLGVIGGFAVDVATDYFIDYLRQGNTNPSTTGDIGADDVSINYRDPSPNGQNTEYPESNYNYAYDALSRHEIRYVFDNDTSLIGQTIGLKFRMNAEYVDERTSTIDTVYSEWVKVEFLLKK
jgi:hypothetical protein